MQKKISTIWRILLPAFMLFAVAPFVFTLQQASQQLDNIHTSAQQQALTLVRLLNVTDNLVGEQALTAIQLLRQRTKALGQPELDDKVSIGAQRLPSLQMGETQIANNVELVDGVTQLFGGTATIFARQGNDFIRITTNVVGSDGQRAIGTKLDPDGDVILALHHGRTFQGVVDILGEPYITIYSPMFNKNNQVIGAYYVGYKVDMKVLREAVENARHLKTGFVAVQGHANKIRFLSAHINVDQASALLKSKPASWVFVSEAVPEWGFNVVVAYPLSEARTLSFANSWLVVTAGLLFGVILIALILWQFRRLIFDPIGSDPALAIDVVQRMASGDLAQDGIQAKPHTLMANVLDMRQKLRETIEVLHQNTARMSLSASVFEHARDGIFITDAQGHVVEVNPAFTAITGHTREEVLGFRPEELGFCTYDEDLLPTLWRSSESNHEWRGETWSRRKNDEVYASWLDIFTVHDEQQNIRNFVGLFSDITTAKEQQQNLERMAYHDPLTQLPNRALLSDRLQQALARTERSGELLAVCVLDLDGFKPVNDTLGHEAGDYLLVQLAVRMNACLRDSDTVARLGGDEFAILLSGLQSIDECKQTLARLLHVIKMPYQISEKSVTVSSSIGYTIFPDDSSEPDTLLRHADHAMYQAKVNGGSRIQQFDAAHERNFKGLRQDRVRIEQALASEEFCLFYQPKVDIREGKIVGMEALIRWQHPELGLRSPATFLSIIEETDFSIVLGEWVVRTALQQIGVWQKLGLEFQVSVNISARHIVQSNFTERLSLILAEFPQVAPQKLELEITETAAIEDVSGVAQTIQGCKQLGVSFALDDFGVGYSSLTYLRRLPVETIKIDQSFVRDMLQDVDDLAVVAGVISLSRDFKRKVVAEGVETSEQGVWLLRMGCSVIQGYGIARPMPADDVLSWAVKYQQDPSWTQGLV